MFSDPKSRFGDEQAEVAAKLRGLRLFERSVAHVPFLTPGYSRVEPTSTMMAETTIWSPSLVP
jgi:hypothetical protein